MGPYCAFCDRRCFVYRRVIVGGEIVWAGLMGTCAGGRAFDVARLGVDARGAFNPRASSVS